MNDITTKGDLYDDENYLEEMMNTTVNSQDPSQQILRCKSCNEIFAIGETHVCKNRTTNLYDFISSKDLNNIIDKIIEDETNPYGNDDTYEREAIDHINNFNPNNVDYIDWANMSDEEYERRVSEELENHKIKFSKEHHSLNFDKEQVEKLVRFVKPLKEGETYMMLLASRNKYLLDENKISYRDSHGSNIIDRQLIRPNQNMVQKIEQILHRWSSEYGAYLSKDGKNYPNEMLIPYIKINPNNMVKAYFNFKKAMIEIEQEFAYGIVKEGEILKKFNRLDRMLMSNIQASYSEKYILDLDIDLLPEHNSFGKASIVSDIIKVICEYCKDFDKTNYKIIETFGGYHILFEKETLDCNGFYNGFLKNKSKYGFIDLVKEIELNKEYMIPLVGCYQGNKQVRIK